MAYHLKLGIRDDRGMLSQSALRTQSNARGSECHLAKDDLCAPDRGGKSGKKERNSNILGNQLYDSHDRRAKSAGLRLFSAIYGAGSRL
jgi:hypothetical protein